MNIGNYGKVSTGREKKLKRRITGIVIILVIILAGAFVIGVLTDDGPEYQLRSSAIEENHILKEQVIQLQNQVLDLQNQVSVLEGQVSEKDAYISTLPTDTPDVTEEPAEDPSSDWQQSSPRDIR